MFIKKFLEQNKVDEVNTLGQFIKVMNCESVLRIRATYQGRLVLETDARAGFDVQTTTPFDYIEITSNVAQKLEIWVSKHKLSYDALSTKPNRSQSFVVEHFGQTQNVLPYDPSQAGAKVVSEELGFWVGGEGVNKESGIYSPAGAVYIHDSAAPLYAFVDATPDKVVSGVVGSVGVSAGMGGSDYVLNGDFALHKTFDSAQMKTLITNVVTGVSTDFINEPVYSPIALNNKFVGIRVNDPRDIVLIDSDGAYSFMTNPNVGGFTSRCLVESVDGGFFVLGEGYSTNPNKVIKYLNGIWSSEGVPAALVGNNIVYAFKDKFDDAIWLKANDGVYVSNDNLKTVDKINELDGVSFSSMSFSDSAVMFKSKTTCFVMTRGTRDLTNLHSKFTDFAGATLIGEQWIVVSERFIYGSSNKFVTSNVIYEHTFNFSKGDIDKLVMCEQQGDELLVWANSNEKSEIVKLALEDDLANPKAKIKVFKESF